MTVIIGIGNSDNKLTQEAWSRYCRETDGAIRSRMTTVFFHGFTPSDAPKQSASWVFEQPAPLSQWEGLLTELRDIAGKYRQDSIAVTCGETEIVPAHPVWIQPAALERRLREIDQIRVNMGLEPDPFQELRDLANQPIDPETREKLLKDEIPEGPPMVGGQMIVTPIIPDPRQVW